MRERKADGTEENEGNGKKPHPSPSQDFWLAGRPRGGSPFRGEAADLEKKSLNGVSFRLFSLPFIMGCFFLFAPSDALGNQDMLGVGEAEGGSEAFGVVGSADDIVQPHGGAEQAHVLVGGTRMHGREKLFAVFLGVGDVNQPYRGFADKAPARRGSCAGRRS